VYCEMATNPKFSVIITIKNVTVLFKQVICLDFVFFRICAIMQNVSKNITLASAMIAKTVKIKNIIIANI